MSAPDSKWLSAIVAGFLVLMVGFVAGRASADRPTGVLPDAGNRVESGPPRSGGQPPRGTLSPATRTRHAAVTAATAYAVALDGPSLLDPERRRRLIEEIGARHAQDDLESRLGRVASLLVDRLGLRADVLEDDSFVWRAVPAGWRMVSHGRERAEVAIWTTGVALARGRSLAPQTWRTTFVELVWEREDWRLAGIRSETGPEPLTFATDGSGRVTAEAIRSFEPFVLQAPREDAP